jgi:hypothetical protein
MSKHDQYVVPDLLVCVGDVDIDSLTEPVNLKAFRMRLQSDVGDLLAARGVDYSERDFSRGLFTAP